ncbi:MAG: T9SS type A sorting domain-containing protein [Muribaculaceae bacterium]|nr:T9SS type A sorting domain-containing protein [Muribaculaceae bacterium]
MKHLTGFLILSASLTCMADDTPQPPVPSTPDGTIGGYEYIDLGLPSGTLWATHNIGASSPYEIGEYFAWGEVEPREDFSWESYKFFIGYDYDPEYGTWAVLEDIGTNICGTEYDAARHQWGDRWRLPNADERYELRMLCWSKYTTENGVSGVRIYGPNEHSIFLPGGGMGLWYGDKDPFDSTDSYYWTGEEEPDPSGRTEDPSLWAKNILVQYNTTMESGQGLKAYGICVRPVINPKESGNQPIINDKDNLTLSYRNGYLTINGANKEYNLTLLDLSGRTVYSGITINNSCSLPALTKGIYIVSLSDDKNMVKTQKITIK